MPKIECGAVVGKVFDPAINHGHPEFIDDVPFGALVCGSIPVGCP